jgi:ribosome biogenesis GTPase A
VLEVDPFKKNFILLNKADLLTEEQRYGGAVVGALVTAHRIQWAEYFTKQGVLFAFFSAFVEGDLDQKV